jgi:Flp pilus assembly protein TadG
VRQRRESGSASVEAVALVFPILLLVVLLIIFCFRLLVAHLTISSATAAAARAASLARTPQAASAAALNAATADLAEHPGTCAAMRVDLDGALFGRGGEAVVTMTCHIAVRDLIGLSLPGKVIQQDTSRSPIDTYRASAGTQNGAGS